MAKNLCIVWYFTPAKIMSIYKIKLDHAKVVSVCTNLPVEITLLGKLEAGAAPTNLFTLPVGSVLVNLTNFIASSSIRHC